MNVTMAVCVLEFPSLKAILLPRWDVGGGNEGIIFIDKMQRIH